MKKIFKEYGGIIIVVIAIVALIGLVSALMQPGGVLNNAFGNIAQAFVDKTDELVENSTSINYDAQLKSIAHRGYSAMAPENTMAAFELAKEMGFKYVETDVQFTSDGVAVLLHDETIDRTSDGSGTLNQMTYEEVSQYDFGGWKASSYTGTQIPTFEEFIIWCKNNNIHPYIEIKFFESYSDETVQDLQALVNTVKDYGMENKVSWITFTPAYLRAVKQISPSARLVLLTESIDDSSTLINHYQQLKTDDNDVAIDVKYSAVTTTNIEPFKAANIPLEVYGLDSSVELKKLDSYISGVTNNGFFHAGKDLYASNTAKFEVVKELTSSDLLYSTGLLNTPKKYYASTTAYKGRAAYVAFDIPVEEGYIYKFEFTSTASSPEFGAIIINDTALSLVEQKLDHGLENQFNTGWQKSGLTVEIPASINGSDAAVVRFNFRSNDDSITEDFITGVTISRCRVR